MQGARTSLRYAKALFETAKTHDDVEGVLLDLKMLENIINQKSEFFKLINNPTISDKKKEDLFVKLFKNKTHKTTMQFLLFLLKKGRESMLAQIIKNYKSLNLEEQQIVLAEVVTATPISEEIRREIKRKISSNKKVQLVEKIDLQILGGLIINRGDLQYDFSVRKKLNNVKRAFKL